jgi:hypothetical protein
MADWDWANRYMLAGRKKYERTLYDRGLRMWRTNKWDINSDIALGWKASWTNADPFIIYHKDGSTTIQGQDKSSGPYTWQPLNSYSVRFTIQRYADINVIQHKHKFYLIENNPQISPPKIQGCRTCSQTGLVDGYCYSTSCYKSVATDDGDHYCEEHDIKTKYRWHECACPHGNTNAHEVKKGFPCNTCNGSKKHDYGSKPHRTMWDGSPLRIRDGKIIKSGPSLLERMIADYAEPIS